MNFFAKASLSVVTMVVASVSYAQTSQYVVKGGFCADGSAFNSTESIPEGTVLTLDAAELKKVVKQSQGAFFFFRGDERNVFLQFKSGKDFEYKSGKAPCPNESWSVISLEKI